MKAWITKYVLSKGILEREGEVSGDNFRTRNPDWQISYEDYYGEGRVWHRTQAGAVKRAKQMRRDRLTSLQKQTDRIKALRFDGAGDADVS